MRPFPIRSENSALPTNTLPNPMVRAALERVKTLARFGITSKSIVVDQGCGKLRHLRVCSEYAHHLILVDTPEQIRRKQKFAGITCTMAEYVASLNHCCGRITIIESVDFTMRRVEAHIVISVAVMDVVLPNVRHHIIDSAFRNLRRRGFFVVIVPRNISSILKRCNDNNKLSDGHVFRRPGCDFVTFYANLRDHTPLRLMAIRAGFELVQDISVYHQVCLIFQRP